MEQNNKMSCFYCTHLILDGLNSWCELRRAGEVCECYEFNKQRYESVIKYDKAFKNKQCK